MPPKKRNLSVIASSNKQNRKRRRDSENDPSSIKEDDIKSSTVTNRKTSKKSVTTNGKTEKKLPTTNGNTSTDLYCHWLMKSEPESRFEKGIDVKFGIEDLKQCENQTACWDGVRNYQARNFMRDQMKIDHDMFFYHSNCKEPGIAGLCKIVRESYPDHTQFDSKDPHYDSSSKKDNPKWFMVDVKFVRMLKRFIPLSELKSIHLQHKADGGPLKNMALFTRARLSVQPVTKEEWDFIISLENEK